MICYTIAVLCLAATQAAPSLPTWGDYYLVEGTIILPYAEIFEPFHAYYNAKLGLSRLDYYNGAVMSFQHSNETEYGTTYKVIYNSMDTKNYTNQRICFKFRGIKGMPGMMQPALPDVRGFQFKDVTKRVLSGGKTVEAQIWQNSTVNGQKKNTYTMWVTNDENQTPIVYEMMGYDSLFGSHYDKYFIEYRNFVKVEPAASTFEVPSDVGACQSPPGPGLSHATGVSMNPMQEFVGRQTNEHLDEEFGHFKQRHGKKYQGHSVHTERHNNFRHNYRFIQSTNRRNDLTYKVAVNHMADMSKDEIQQITGNTHDPKAKDNGGAAFDHKKYSGKLGDVPEFWDWRYAGAVTPVKDQAICGSCWSFGTVGTIEGALFLKTGQLVRLSQQELIDCSWGEGNNGCDGGEDFRAYKWIMNNGGLASEDSYGLYKGQDMKCKAKNVSKTAHMSGWTNVTSGNLTALKISLFNHGPISVGIDASHLSFAFYANGVYYEKDCSTVINSFKYKTPNDKYKTPNDKYKTPSDNYKSSGEQYNYSIGSTDLDHSVLAVGYGVWKNEPYWLIKNSWSTYWGNDGYVMMSQKDNNCGVATSPTFVTIA